MIRHVRRESTVRQSGTVRAAFKIIFDVARFRLARLEMANLVAAVALMLAFRLEAVEIAGRVMFGSLLNLLVYLNNDFHDVADDVQSGTRDQQKTSFLHQNLRAAIGAQVGLLAVLAIVALAWRIELLVPLVLGGGSCWLYSARFKRMPGLDVLSMTIWGAMMPLVGVPLWAVAGWVFVGQLGLFSMVFESIQVLRDRIEDAKRGASTTAVRLGVRKTTLLIRLGLVGAAGYAIALLSLWAGLLVALATTIPTRTSTTVYWNRIRLLLGVAFVIECLTFWFVGETRGLLIQIPLDSRF